MKEKNKLFNQNICEDGKSALFLPSFFVTIWESYKYVNFGAFLVVFILGLLCVTLEGCGGNGVLIGSADATYGEMVPVDGEALAADGETLASDGETLTTDRELPASDGEVAENDSGERGVAVADGRGARITKGENTVIVHICGQVVNPGVYELPGGSRIISGVEAAGGFAEEACPEAVNLSAVLQDSQRVYIPSVEEKGDTLLVSENFSVNDEETAGKININTADESTLTLITGIGETRAKSIIKYRENHGEFKKIEDIMNVSGIGEASFEKMKDMITVE